MNLVLITGKTRKTGFFPFQFFHRWLNLRHWSLWPCKSDYWCVCPSLSGRSPEKYRYEAE